MTKEYHKIRGIYKFYEKTHLPIQEIDEYFDNLKDCKRIFTEKIDGTNIRIIRDGHKPQFAGRTDNAQIPPRLLNRLQEVFIEELFEQKFGETPVTLYGEGYGGKIQKGGVYRTNEDFILFDVEINGVRLERDNVHEIGEYFQVPIVPIQCEGTLHDGIGFVMNGERTDNTVCKERIEGLIGYPVGGFLDRMGKRIIVKIKQEHFKTLPTK